jgi:hypothetical protein
MWRQIEGMRYVSPHISRTRAILSIGAALTLALAVALAPGVAEGRVDPIAQTSPSAATNPDVVAIVTGGGTVTVTVPVSLVASFGINGKRPTDFVQNGTGTAIGRINYSKHAQVDGRHVNVPVRFMLVELSVNPSPNGTGGRAQLIGDCSATGAECPQTAPATASVLVEVEDNSDMGATNDVFRISFCVNPPSANVAALGCGAAEGGPIRSGNIQIRANVSGSSGVAPTAARAPLRVP